MGDHIELNLGNIIIIGGISALTTIAGLAVLHVLSNKDVPVVSPTARGTVDFINAATNAA